MSTDLEVNARARSRGVTPPHLVTRDFLDEGTVAALLDYALSRQSEFAPTRVGSKVVNPTARVSKGLRDLGSYRAILKAKIIDLMPVLVARLQVTPFEASKFETELVAHGDGAFYKRHSDTRTARNEDMKYLRVLSGVYYFNAEPRAFTGGALRLYAIGSNEAEDFVDIEPLRNSLLVFPSWAPHEVMPVSCPSRRFIDSRFAVNCWVYCNKPGASA
jgi:SM-20-related protein